MKNKILSYEVNNKGIGLMTIDMKDYPANLLSFDFVEEYAKTAQLALKDSKVKGVIVCSAQKLFMAGADLRLLSKPMDDPNMFFKIFLNIHKQFRTIETGGKPFVAALAGTALGGGLELALTCHHRIALNSPKIKIGFPEITLGLLPGAGGTLKSPYLMGLQTALTYLLTGRSVKPNQAYQDGLINDLANDEADLFNKAETWILNNPNPIQPWDAKKVEIPGVNTPNVAQIFTEAIGNFRKKTQGNYPSAEYLISALHDGLALPIDRALELEARYFIKALGSKEAKNQIRTGFFFMKEAAKGKNKPQGYDFYTVKKLGILGAGMMGAGIAYVSALKGMEVILKDRTLALATKGKLQTEKRLQLEISKGKITQDQAQNILDRIKPTTSLQNFKDVDYVVEAVFEDPNLKSKVIEETEVILGKGKVLGSNTSTLPITMLAKSTQVPERFIGIHFFSPVDKMALVEIIVGQKTSKKTIAATVDYVLAIGKIPIIVKDSHGFFTTRCFSTFTSEAAFLLEEGTDPLVIENSARKIGMPVGPLAIIDEISLSLNLAILKSDPTLGKNEETDRLYSIFDNLVNKYGRLGKKAKKGFYDYPEGKKKKIWTGLQTIFPQKSKDIDPSILSKRLLHRQALEAYRCFEEGVLTRTQDADVGSVLGWGFPIYTGGAIAYIDYIGLDNFIDDCDRFTKYFGKRFEIPESLRQKLKKGKKFY